MAGRGRTKGGAIAAWIGARRLVRPDPEERPEARDATSGAPEGAPAVNAAGGRLRKGAQLFCAFRRSAPSFEGARREGAAPAPKLTPGADESHLYDT